MASMTNDFYGSIDKLVDFGMSGQLAQSMMQTMNTVIANTQIPNYSLNNKIDMTNQVAVSPVEQRFYVVINDSTIGPLSMDELSLKVVQKDITGESLVWYKGLPGWVEAKKLEELTLLFK